MPQLCVKHVLSFTSEDSKHKVENMLKGKGIWLCNSREHSGIIKVDFQLPKASTIDYIDIGNHFSAMISIDVGMSSWPTSQNLVSLLPTVVLMTPSECRLGQNSKGVRMFKKGDLDQNNVKKKWDQVRITCSQPFKKNIQFGLSFLKLYTHQDISDNGPQLNASLNEDPKKKNFPPMLSKNSSQSMPESIKILEQSRVNNDISDKYCDAQSKNISSPISRAAKLVMAHKHVANEIEGKQQKKDLEMEALTFLMSMNLTSNDIHSLKVSHIREEFEVRRKNKLNTREKLIFKHIALDYATERLKKLEDKSKPEKIPYFEGISSTESSNELLRTGSPSNSSRNNVALMDCFVTPSPARKRKYKPDSKEKPTFKNLKLETITIDLSDSEDAIVLDDEQECSFSLIGNSQNVLGLTPIDKFGTLRRLDNSAISEVETEIMECPLCAEFFPKKHIEEHCSTCDGTSNGNNMSPAQEKCPVCGRAVKLEELQEHADECAENNFS